MVYYIPYMIIPRLYIITYVIEIITLLLAIIVNDNPKYTIVQDLYIYISMKLNHFRVIYIYIYIYIYIMVF